MAEYIPIPSPDSPNWIELPTEVTADILKRLSVLDILEAAQWVCTTWYRVCKDPSMWRSIKISNIPLFLLVNVERLGQHAIDLSCGQLNNITLEDCYYTTELLHYIADRSPQLRSLRLVSCHNMNVGLGAVAKKLPNLEELHIFSNPVPKESLEIFGCFCPKLKSLMFDIIPSRVPYLECDEEALVIARTMPGLSYLSLIRNQMTNYGLKAILDQCPHLESLDLRLCSNVNLGGDFGKTCAQRIMNLKHPNDSTDGYEFDAIVNGGFTHYYSYEDDDVPYVDNVPDFYMSNEEYAMYSP